RNDVEVRFPRVRFPAPASVDASRVTIDGKRLRLRAGEGSATLRYDSFELYPMDLVDCRRVRLDGSAVAWHELPTLWVSPRRLCFAALELDEEYRQTVALRKPFCLPDGPLPPAVLAASWSLAPPARRAHEAAPEGLPVICPAARTRDPWSSASAETRGCRDDADCPADADGHCVAGHCILTFSKRRGRPPW
ncbi:MAG: hypothetical protein ACYCWW_10855, partial [Deltaproteobacteria bacterium]